MYKLLKAMCVVLMSLGVILLALLSQILSPAVDNQFESVTFMNSIFFLRLSLKRLSEFSTKFFLDYNSQPLRLPSPPPPPPIVIVINPTRREYLDQPLLSTT